MLPAQRCDVGEQLVWYSNAASAQMPDGSVEIDGIPQRNSCGEEGQAGGAMTLVLEGAVAQHAETVEEDTGIIRRQGKALGIVRIQAFRAWAFPMACLHAWSRLRAKGTAISTDTIMAERNAAWVGDLAAAIADLKARGADALAIDVGHNDGGDWLARLPLMNVLKRRTKPD